MNLKSFSKKIDLFYGNQGFFYNPSYNLTFYKFSFIKKQRMIKFTSKLQLRKAVQNYFNCQDTSDISNWDTSEITDMSRLFEYIKQISVEPITLNWNTNNVTDMSWMFYDCQQDFILNFDTSNVTNMFYMFCSAKNFNQPLNWNTKNVTIMAYMFSNATNFNQPLNWNTQNVTYMNHMFSRATNFNQPLNFNTSNVIDMSAMFYYATNFNQPLHINTENITCMYWTFFNATNYNQPIYFQSNDRDKYRNIFKYSPIKEQTQKYILTPAYYKKLFVMYALNCVNPELLYLLDEFEEFI
jgi:hypothetical protein